MQPYRELEYYKGYRIQIVNDEDGPNPRQEFDNFGHIVCWHSRYCLGDVDRNCKHKERWHRDFESFREYFLEHKDEFAVILTLYLYDHSGITLRVDKSGFEMADADGWDWGPVGLTYCTLEEVWKEYGKTTSSPDEPFSLTQHVITQEMKDKAKALLIAEVETYDQYLTGDVWGYTVDTYIGETEEDGEPVDPEDYLETDDLWEEVMETGYVSGGKDAEGNVVWKAHQMPMSCWDFFGKKYCLEEAKIEVDAHIAYMEKKEAERVEKLETSHQYLFVEREAIGL